MHIKLKDDRSAHTIDAFQGDQAQIVIVSMVRNNTEKDHMRAIGFLREASRLNVLYSRAEQLLVLVGSLEFFQRHVREVSISDIYHPLWHWRKSLATLEDCFLNGTAVRIDVTQLID